MQSTVARLDYCYEGFFRMFTDNTLSLLCAQNRFNLFRIVAGRAGAWIVRVQDVSIFEDCVARLERTPVVLAEDISDFLRVACEYVAFYDAKQLPAALEHVNACAYDNCLRVMATCNASSEVCVMLVFDTEASALNINMDHARFGKLRRHFAREMSLLLHDPGWTKFRMSYKFFEQYARYCVAGGGGGNTNSEASLQSCLSAADTFLRDENRCCVACLARTRLRCSRCGVEYYCSTHCANTHAGKHDTCCKQLRMTAHAAACIGAKIDIGKVDATCGK